MNNAKSPPLTKEEVNLLISLIGEESVIMSKGTTAGCNKLKDQAWQRVTEHFNSRIESCPRRPDQLRLKWENLKKNARKRVTLKKCEYQSGYSSLDDILDNVLMLLEKRRGSDGGESGSNGENGGRKADDSDMESKSQRLTIEEVNLLISLIREENVIMRKVTTAGSNKLKEQAWQRVTEQFNSRIESSPRRPDQLRLKWENLKKNARKRMTQKKSSMDDILDNVLVLLETRESDSGELSSNGENCMRKADDSDDMEAENSQMIRETSEAKGPPLTKQEVSLLVSLIRDHSIIMNKQTTADSNRLKDQAWQQVTEQFNARIDSCPRRANQLRLKWDNLKKTARSRRRMTQKQQEIRMGYNPMDDIFDTVLMLLESRSDSGESGSNGENCTRKADDSDEMDVENSQMIGESPETYRDPLYEVVKISSATHSEIDSDSDNESEVEMQEHAYCGPIKTNPRKRDLERRKSDIVRKNIAIAEYYEAKKRKIELEIKKLQLELNLQIRSSSCNPTSHIVSVECEEIKQEIPN